MFTPLLVNTGNERILFDTGLGVANGGRLPEHLTAAGMHRRTRWMSWSSPTATPITSAAS